MIVAGFGYRSGATPASLRAALVACGTTPTALAAPADKLATLAPLAVELGLPLIPISPAVLTATETHTQSPASLAARDTGSVAEASALAAAGPGAQLLIPRRISPDRMATCAIAQGTTA
ncbi:cobalamin biosynthesis protein [Sphingomonas prati]|nr:cobalamin biosynthesis protein [Sphingomonas prati]GGE71814.1 precorrin methylase [Sphingomonas prati]